MSIAGLHSSFRPRFATALFVALLSLTLFARSAHAEALSLTLAEAMARAEQRAPEVVLAGRLAGEARAQRLGAGVVLPVNPRLSADARPPITGGTIRDAGYAAQLEAFFDLGGAPGARVREALRAHDVALADLALERLRGRIAAWIAYVEVRVAEKRLEETQALLAIASRIADAAQRRASAGASGDIEIALAAVDRAQLRAAIESAARQREEQVATLRDVLDLPPAQALVLTTALEEPPPPPALDALLARAVDRRPELAQLRTRLAHLEARSDRLSRERFPRIGAYVGVDAAPLSPVFGVIGLSVELPVAQRNQGPLAVTLAERATTSERQEIQVRRIHRELVALLSAYESRRAELDLVVRESVPAAARTLDLVEAGWLAGRFDVFRVASASRDVARVRASRIDALQAAWLACIALERAAGGGTP